MNERDELLTSYVMASMGEDPMGPILIDVNSTMFVRVNLVILKGFLQTKGSKGLFITVDRPHQYMEHLLRMHYIGQKNLIFVDAIGRFAADRKGGTVPVGYQAAPFHIDTLLSALDSTNDENVPRIDLDQCDFAMIDNIAALLPYNSYSSVEMFLKKFVMVMSSHSDIVTPLLIDREMCGPLYEAARSLCSRTIDCRTENLPPEAGGTGKDRSAELMRVIGSSQSMGGKR